MDIDHLRRVASEIRKKEETDRSLRVAHDRQLRMLPPNPVVEGYEFAVRYVPAADVSGDFYDFIPLGSGTIGIVIADVSGHGVGAAIIMGMAKQTVSIFGRQIEKPAEVLRATNEELYRSLDGKTFVSMSYGVLDVKGRVIRFARAGQNKPYRFNPRWSDPTPKVIECKGLALGVDKGPRFAKAIEEVKIELQPGDVFFQYTDGLVEAANKEHVQYGEQQLAKTLKRYGRTGVTELLDIIIESLKDFTRSAEQEDDITMVALKVSDPQLRTRTARLDAVRAPAPGAQKSGGADPPGWPK